MIDILQKKTVNIASKYLAGQTKKDYSLVSLYIIHDYIKDACLDEDLCVAVKMNRNDDLTHNFVKIALFPTLNILLVDRISVNFKHKSKNIHITKLFKNSLVCIFDAKSD
jgi:hypothetical protein